MENIFLDLVELDKEQQRRMCIRHKKADMDDEYLKSHLVSIAILTILLQRSNENLPQPPFERSSFIEGIYAKQLSNNCVH